MRDIIFSWKVFREVNGFVRFCFLSGLSFSLLASFTSIANVILWTIVNSSVMFLIRRSPSSALSNYVLSLATKQVMAHFLVISLISSCALLNLSRYWRRVSLCRRLMLVRSPFSFGSDPTILKRARNLSTRLSHHWMESCLRDVNQVRALLESVPKSFYRALLIFFGEELHGGLISKKVVFRPWFPIVKCKCGQWLDAFVGRYL